MTFDANKYRPERPPWLEGKPDLPRTDAPLRASEQKGPKGTDRKVLTVLTSRTFWRLREWLRG